jgi:hypothetical protein
MVMMDCTPECCPNCGSPLILNSAIDSVWHVWIIRSGCEFYLPSRRAEQNNYFDQQIAKLKLKAKGE